MEIPFSIKEGVIAQKLIRELQIHLHIMLFLEIFLLVSFMIINFSFFRLLNVVKKLDSNILSQSNHWVMETLAGNVVYYHMHSTLLFILYTIG